MFDKPKYDTLVNCIFCEWHGTLKECQCVPYSTPFDHTLSGREGYHYLCPVCKSVVHRWYWKVS